MTFIRTHGIIKPITGGGKSCIMERNGLRKMASWCREALIPKGQSRKQVFRNMTVTLALLGGASLLCAFLNQIGDSDQAVPMIFVLAVLLTSRITDGYFYGLFATVVSVFGVNYIFTYPYFAFNFTITGYPITFLTMFAVSTVVGMLTEQVKRQSRIEAEAEIKRLKTENMILQAKVTERDREIAEIYTQGAEPYIDYEEQTFDLEI